MDKDSPMVTGNLNIFNKNMGSKISNSSVFKDGFRF